MRDQRYYEGVKKVQVLDGVAAVNVALAGGAILLRIADVSTETTEESGKVSAVRRPWFILGWTDDRPSERKSADQSETTQGSEPTPKRRSFPKTCDRCGKKIRMEQGEDGKWHPVNSDSTTHRCSD